MEKCLWTPVVATTAEAWTDVSPCCGGLIAPVIPPTPTGEEIGGGVIGDATIGDMMSGD